MNLRILAAVLFIGLLVLLMAPQGTLENVPFANDFGVTTVQASLRNLVAQGFDEARSTARSFINGIVEEAFNSAEKRVQEQVEEEFDSVEEGIHDKVDSI
jgi:VIT1/CCC1 family predicted Fe2+/Mn2+ transporter